MNTFTTPLMNEDSPWFAVPGRMSPARALRVLINERMLDWLLDDLSMDYSLECGDCDGEGCAHCDLTGSICRNKEMLMGVARSVRSSWVSQVPPPGANGPEDWYWECDELHPGAEPAMVLDLG